MLLLVFEKDTSRRYTSAGVLADDLQRFLDGYPVEARATSRFYATRKLIGRHRFVSTAVLLSAIALAGVAVAMTVLEQRAAQQAAIARQTTRFLLGLFEANDRAQSARPHRPPPPIRRQR